MTLIAPTLQAFFTDRLTRQLQASPRTIASYRDTLRLLLGYVNDTTGKQPCGLDWDDLDEPLITRFLEHLETDRHNSPRTRNLRLTAIRSLFKYAALHHPEHAAVIARVLAIPPKRFEKRTVTYLTSAEAARSSTRPTDSAGKAAATTPCSPSPSHAGLRVSELIGLDCDDVVLGTGAHVRCHGKGRKQRAVPLTNDAQAVLATWLGERAGRPHDPLFSTRTGRRLSRDAVEQRVSTHAKTAAIALGVAEDQAAASARAPPQLRDVAAAGRRRQHRDRALARTRRRPLHPALPARRPHDQRESARAHHAADRHARPLQAPGRPSGLPRGPVTMPISGPARALGTHRLAGTSQK